jgi:hypothetical protein
MSCAVCSGQQCHLVGVHHSTAVTLLQGTPAGMCHSEHAMLGTCFGQGRTEFKLGCISFNQVHNIIHQ